MGRYGFLILAAVLLLFEAEAGILYPRSTSKREFVTLDGVWKFTLSSNGSFDGDSLTGSKNDKDLFLMPVPASYNDVLTTLAGRDHVGPVKYARQFYVARQWISDNRVWLRFGSVCYSAAVYINGNLTVSHEIGHLPFQVEITDFVIKGVNNISVYVDNTLTGTTIPQGSVGTIPGGRKKQSYTFDFFNYAGIDRSVHLYSTPDTYVDDLTITTQIKENTGIVNYEVKIGGTYANVTPGEENEVDYLVTILDKEGKTIVSSALSPNASGTLEVPDANFWWPYLMNDNPGYLYTLRVDLIQWAEIVVDRYEQPFGIRELSWDNTTFKINGKNIYFRGFGRHEDSDIRGKGLDLPLIVRDHNLMKWLGANSYRTSHYPYAEEIMDMADSLGIMIIDEVPAVNTENYNSALLENHKSSLTQLYQRDKNRPSVVVWSVANEPRTQVAESEDYYRHIVAHIKSFDNLRPVTIANMYSYDVDHSGQFLDILSFNKYESWYEYPGDLDVIIPKIVAEAEGWHKKHNKPVLVTEYGADTFEGLHTLPTFIWSEEFQLGMMAEHFEAFDQLREKGWFIGEMIWNFADFKTEADVRRVGGNKKGIFTRQRQPKVSAHLMRKRYWSLAEELDNAIIPTDLDSYVTKKKYAIKSEL